MIDIKKLAEMQKENVRMYNERGVSFNQHGHNIVSLAEEDFNEAFSEYRERIDCSGMFIKETEAFGVRFVSVQSKNGRE